MSFLCGGLATAGVSGPLVTGGLPPLIVNAGARTAFASTGTRRGPDPGWSLGTATILVGTGGVVVVDPADRLVGGWGGYAWDATTWDGAIGVAGAIVCTWGGGPWASRTWAQGDAGSTPVGPSTFASTGQRRGPDPGWAQGRNH